MEQGFLSPPTQFPDSWNEALNKLGSRKDELVKKCVHAFIILGQDKLPIKKADVSRVAMPSVTNYRAVNALIHLANEELQDVFGMRLYHVDKIKFFLVNTNLETDYLRATTEDENEELVLLFFTLMAIFMASDSRLTSQDLEKTLKPFSSDLLKDHLDKYVKQMYLVTLKYKDALFYSWGPRAYAEFDLDAFFRCFLQISKEPNREAWPELVQKIDKWKKYQGAVYL